MFSLQGKKIILGITGSIAAYKAALLTRLLVKAGAEVRVLMTRAATDFITPLTLSTLSKHPVLSDIHTENGWNSHVELGLWADALVIAPCTATTLAKLSNGLSDNLLTATYLSARCPVFFAPAMDLDMWLHPAVLNNVERLKTFGNHLIDVEHGELASGLTGNGRMAEPEHIMEQLAAFFDQQLPKPLLGKRVLVTSGPTYEPIDPVRFIGNRSSGKMGTALADELARQGAEVVLVTGPTRIKPTQPRVKMVALGTAQEMYEACLREFPTADITVLAAAVADYTPEAVASQKIKKSGETLTLTLRKTKDIARELGSQKRADQFIVGFALETEHELANAEEKLRKKNFDLIVLNSLNDAGAGFNHETNKITTLNRHGDLREFGLKSKTEVAADIVQLIVDMI